MPDDTWPLLLNGSTRDILQQVIRRSGLRSNYRTHGLVTRGRSAVRRCLFIGTGLGSIMLVFALAVSFLAASNTTQARAPGTDDEVAVVPPVIVGKFRPIAVPDYGPAEIYLDVSTTLRIVEEPPPPPQSLLNTEVIHAGAIDNVNITFYDCANQGFCAHMYNGEWVYEGAAACSWNLPLGTAFYIENDPTKRIYICKDRGWLPDTWVDIFWYYPSDGYNWQAHVGRYGTIHIVHLP